MFEYSEQIQCGYCGYLYHYQTPLCTNSFLDQWRLQIWCNTDPYRWSVSSSASAMKLRKCRHFDLLQYFISLWDKNMCFKSDGIVLVFSLMKNISTVMMPIFLDSIYSSKHIIELFKGVKQRNFVKNIIICCHGTSCCGNLNEQPDASKRKYGFLF